MCVCHLNTIFVPVPKKGKNPFSSSHVISYSHQHYDSGDSEIPPSLPRMRDRPANVSVDVCCTFETNLCWHPWVFMMCTEGTKHWLMPMVGQMWRLSLGDVFGQKSEQVWINCIDKNRDFPRVGLLSMETYSIILNLLINAWNVPPSLHKAHHAIHSNIS